LEVLADFLAARQLLLVVDNCEHLMPACAVLLAELLEAAPELRVLATSREILHIPGEQVYPVAPLAVPDPDRAGAVAGAQYPAMELFADRAGSALHGFAVTADNARQVAQVCQRLDGIPLAIELAASRLYALSLTQLATLLEDRFRLLTGGNRAALPRHQTLRAAVEWSFELCAKPERLMWIRASVFAGRFDLEAAERVCGDDGLASIEVLDALLGLVDKSVLVAEDDNGTRRYRLLETLRQYGLERLRQPDYVDVACGVAALDETVLRRRHREFYLELAERFDADWFGPRQPAWTRRMCSELADLRAAMGFSLDRPADVTAGLRLAGALYYFWYGCGEIREGRWWLDRALAADPEPTWERMRALAAYARLLLLQGESAAAVDSARQCLELARRFGEPFYVSHALQTLGLGSMYLGDRDSAPGYLRDAVAQATELGTGSPAVAFTTFALAFSELLIDGDPQGAAALLAHSSTICRAHGDLWWLGNVLCGSVIPALRLGDIAQATSYGQEALRVRRSLHDEQGAASAVDFLAQVAAAAGDHLRAARLLGATDRYWQLVGGSPFATGQWRQQRLHWETVTRQVLGESRYETELRRGGELSLDDAVAYALRDKPAADAGAGDPDGPRLTPREKEIAQLVGQGLTNKEIAGRLFISRRTAESHVENILAKFGFNNRNQVVVWYTQHRQPPTSG
jgi:predicted ATPase/DNA-binding CsgD family transcriptional regulator